MWQGGSVVGCLLDLDAREVIFSLDGRESGILKQIFGRADKLVIKILLIQFNIIFIM